MRRGSLQIATAALICIAANDCYAVDCARDIGACSKQCGASNASEAYLSCTRNCFDSYKACVGQLNGDALRGAKCSIYDNDDEPYRAALSSALSAKEKRLSERLNDLKNIKGDLENEYKWRVGDEGSLRDSLTKFAAATRVSAQLFESLIGFGASKELSDSGAILRSLQAGRKIRDIIEKDAETLATDILLEIYSRSNVAARSLKAVKDFTSNVEQLNSLRSDLDIARKEFAQRLAVLSEQMSRTREEMQQASLDEWANQLAKPYAEAQKSCESGRKR